jgi:uncharacterized protein (TIGR03435 family)
MRCRMIRRSVAIATLILSSAAAAQDPAAKVLPQFEVATIKPSAPITDGRVRIAMGGDPGRINYQGLPIKMILARAFDIKDYQISGPDWLDSERFDVMAKIPEGVSREQVPAMLQALLAERFKMTFHRDKKEMGIYALIVAKGGVKMKALEESAEGVGQMQMMGRGHFTSKLTLAGLADFLSRWVDRPVLDMTDTKANYDIKLDWTPEPGQGGMKGVGGPQGPPRGGEEGGSNPDTAGPSLFTAVQEQLGLKLESRKAPVDLLVIDHIEKTPTEN